MSVLRAWWVFGLLGLGMGVLGEGEVTQTQAADVPRRSQMFIMVREEEAQMGGFGMVMMCPAHAHGTPEEAERKLRQQVGVRMDQPATLWVCRSNQIETLRRFGPLVERVVVNPFGSLKEERVDDGRYWPGVDHPVLNALRELRAIVPEIQLLACVDLDGEMALFGQREPAFEEIEWLVYAAIGTGYEGLVWRQSDGDAKRPAPLRRLEAQLKKVAEDLVAAEPVGWVRASGGQPVSALYGKGRLFVVLLSGSYLNTGNRGGLKRIVELPLEERQEEGELLLSLPGGKKVESASTLSGRILEMVDGESVVKIPYRFRGGGELIVCAIFDGMQRGRLPVGGLEAK